MAPWPYLADFCILSLKWRFTHFWEGKSFSINFLGSFPKHVEKQKRKWFHWLTILWTRYKIQNMQDTKKGHSMRKIMGIFGSTPCQLFSAAHVNCAFLCIHNLSINVYYMRNILSCIICTFHILALATCDSCRRWHVLDKIWMWS